MIEVTIDEKELRELGRGIEKLSAKLDDKSLRKVMRKGAKIYVDAAKAAAPVAEQEVYRYNTSKVVKSKRAPKGMGQVIATYKPGNLRDSIKVLPLRRSKRSVIVGPKRSKMPSGVFGGKRVDGYYAPFVEFGTKHIQAEPFLGPSWKATKGGVLTKIEQLLKTQINSAF